MKVLSVLILAFGLATTFALPNEDTEPTIVGAKQCLQQKGLMDTVSCMTLSALSRIEDISTQETINILPGVQLSSDNPNIQRNARQQRTLELPATAEERISKIFDMMFNIMGNLFSGRTLKVKVPESTSNEIQRSMEDGRGKMKKLLGPIMMAIGAKLFAIVPILLGGLALLAVKALVIAKIALVITLVVGAQYLFSGGGLLSKFGKNALNNIGGGGSGYGNQGGYSNGWNNVGTNYGAPQVSYPYARSMEDAQDIAYSSHTK